MIRYALFAAALGLAGCSQQSGPGRAQAPAGLAPPPEATAPAPAARQVVAVLAPMPHEPPTVFESPADLGGRTVARAVAPAAPPLPPTEHFGAAPQTRTPPVRLLDPDPTPKA